MGREQGRPGAGNPITNGLVGIPQKPDMFGADLWILACMLDVMLVGKGLGAQRDQRPREPPLENLDGTLGSPVRGRGSGTVRSRCTRLGMPRGFGRLRRPRGVRAHSAAPPLPPPTCVGPEVTSYRSTLSVLRRATCSTGQLEQWSPSLLTRTPGVI